MGYACPVCEIPQQDQTHLANHLAFGAMLGREGHEAWLDDHIPDWEETGPESLGERAAAFAPEAEFPLLFEDTTDDHDHPPRFEESIPTQLGRQAMGGEASEILAEAEAMTREMYDTEE